MLDWSTCAEVERHPEKLGGAWLFKGTRVPVSALFANLEGGATVDQFIEWFPGVSREQVNSVLSALQEATERRFHVRCELMSAARMLDDLLDPLSRCLDAESAQRLVQMRVAPPVQERIDSLAERANEGLLTPRRTGRV